MPHRDTRVHWAVGQSLSMSRWYWIHRRTLAYGLPEELRRNLTRRGSNTRFPQLAFDNVNEQGILYSVLLFSATTAV